jgi:hypothetical protein
LQVAVEERAAAEAAEQVDLDIYLLQFNQEHIQQVSVEEVHREVLEQSHLLIL